MKTQPPALPKLYIGMGIHKKNWSIHLRADISDHKRLIIPSNSEVLYEYIEKHFQGHDVSLTNEAGCCGFSASRLFKNFGCVLYCAVFKCACKMCWLLFLFCFH